MQKMSNVGKGWRSLVFFAAVAMTGAIDALLDTELFGDTMGSSIVSGIGTVGMMLRYVTTTAVGVGAGDAPTLLPARQPRQPRR